MGASFCGLVVCSRAHILGNVSYEQNDSGICKTKSPPHAKRHAEISTTLDIYAEFLKTAAMEAARKINQKLAESEQKAGRNRPVF